MKNQLLILIAILVIAGCSVPKTSFRLGYVECEEVDVASKIPGRILSLTVKEGQHVTAGQKLAELESGAIRAKVAQAKAALNAAKAQLKMAKKGPRPEEKEMVLRQFNIAKSNLKIVQRTYERILKVYQEGGVSTQEKEVAEFRWNVAKEQYEKARAYKKMIHKGARFEQIQMLESKVNVYAEKLNEAKVYLDEISITAPQPGLVKQINSQVGEIITAGFPIISLLEEKQYIIFNLREDEFKNLKIGNKLKIEIPAIEKIVDLEVFYIAPLADFAKYESTKEKGSWDIKTFEVRVRIPVNLKNLRPGMTAKIFL